LLQLCNVRERWLDLLSSDIKEKAIERAALCNGERLLQVAVGNGRTFCRLALANPDGRNEAVDVDDTRLRRCRTALERCGARSFGLTRADAGKLPFPAESFDLLLCCHCLDAQVLADECVLSDFQRVLAAGGRLVLVARSTGAPVKLGARLLAAGFCDVSQIPYRKLGLSCEVVRGVKIS
jgi:ubiquinone/menaquinone biosynthesis C-methylase UbiE